LFRCRFITKAEQADQPESIIVAVEGISNRPDQIPKPSDRASACSNGGVKFSHPFDLHIAVLQQPLDGMDHPLPNPD
jgi:hypothetical protein